MLAQAIRCKPFAAHIGNFQWCQNLALFSQPPDFKFSKSKYFKFKQRTIEETFVEELSIINHRNHKEKFSKLKSLFFVCLQCHFHIYIMSSISHIFKLVMNCR